MVGWILAPKRCLRGAEGNLCALRGNLPTHQEKESLFLTGKSVSPKLPEKPVLPTRAKLAWLGFESQDLTLSL